MEVCFGGDSPLRADVSNPAHMETDVCPQLPKLAWLPWGRNHKLQRTLLVDIFRTVWSWKLLPEQSTNPASPLSRQQPHPHFQQAAVHLAHGCPAKAKNAGPGQRWSCMLP